MPSELFLPPNTQTKPLNTQVGMSERALHGGVYFVQVFPDVELTQTSLLGPGNPPISQIWLLNTTEEQLTVAENDEGAVREVHAVPIKSCAPACRVHPQRISAVKVKHRQQRLLETRVIAGFRIRRHSSCFDSGLGARTF